MINDHDTSDIDIISEHKYIQLSARSKCIFWWCSLWIMDKQSNTWTTQIVCMCVCVLSIQTVLMIMSECQCMVSVYDAFIESFHSHHDSVFRLSSMLNHYTACIWMCTMCFQSRAFTLTHNLNGHKRGKHTHTHTNIHNSFIISRSMSMRTASTSETLCFFMFQPKFNRQCTSICLWPLFKCKIHTHWNATNHKTITLSEIEANKVKQQQQFVYRDGQRHTHTHTQILNENEQ